VQLRQRDRASTLQLGAVTTAHKHGKLPMNNLAIPIADPKLQAFVADLVASGAVTDPSAYVAALIEDDRRRRAKAQLESMLLDGLKEEATELTAKDWDEMRKSYDERHARRNGQ
jgi:antitoxin ParD1/3/4